LLQRRRDDLGHVVLGWFRLSSLLFPARAGGLRADPVDRAAVRDGQRPGSGAAPVRVIPGRGTPDLEQHLLRDLLGLGRIAQHLPHHPVDRGGQFGVDELERPVVAARHPAQQRGHVRRRGSLGLPLTYLRPAHDPLFEAAGPPDWSCITW
jgi:hypothetical protein